MNFLSFDNRSKSNENGPSNTAQGPPKQSLITKYIPIHLSSNSNFVILSSIVSSRIAFHKSLVSPERISVVIWQHSCKKENIRGIRNIGIVGSNVLFSKIEYTK